MKTYYQAEIETASYQDIRRIQDEKIVKQVRHVYENVPYYKNLMVASTTKISRQD